MNPYAIAAICAASLATGWTANGWRLGEQMQAERNEWAAAEKARTDAERMESDARALELWAADARAQKEITDAEKKAADLERCIAAGRGCGLRVRVAPRACPGVPAGEVTGVGAGAEQTAELDPAARQDYRTLRSGIIRLEQALKVCVSAQ